MFWERMLPRRRLFYILPLILVYDKNSFSLVWKTCAKTVQIWSPLLLTKWNMDSNSKTLYQGLLANLHPLILHPLRDFYFFWMFRVEYLSNGQDLGHGIGIVGIVQSWTIKLSIYQAWYSNVQAAGHNWKVKVLNFFNFQSRFPQQWLGAPTRCRYRSKRLLLRYKDIEKLGLKYQYTRDSEHHEMLLKSLAIWRNTNLKFIFRHRDVRQ